MPIVESMGIGQEGYKNFVRKFGRVALAAAVPTVVWDGSTPYEGWLSAEETLVIVSTSDEDKPGGAGAQLLQWTGQGEDGIEKTYSIELNGTTAVESVTLDPDIKWDTVYTAQAINTEGTNLNPTPTPLVTDLPANRGTITITSKVSTKIMAQISPGLGRTQMMIWRCPADHYAEFDKISIYPETGVNKPIVAQLWARDSKVLSWVCVGQIDIENNIASITFPVPDYITPGTDICLVIIPSQAGTNCSAQMWIEKKPIPNYAQLLAEGNI